MFSAYVGCDENIGQNLLKGLKFVNYDKIIRKDMRVFLKPNFTYPIYKEGITTNPKLLDSLLGFLKDCSSEVTVVESNGGNHSFSADDAFNGHGMREICARNGASLINLSNSSWCKIRKRINSKSVSVTLPKILLEDSDLLVVVPALKVHSMTRVTLALKNLWGCNPDTMRCIYHENLDRKLSLMASLLKPNLVIIDGTYALTDHGPMFGTPIRKNLLIVANNIIVADALGASLMGVNPLSVKHIKTAEEYGLGTTNLSKVKVNRDWSNLTFHTSMKLTTVDWLSKIPFQNELIAKVIFDSPFTKFIRSIAELIKTPEEKIDFGGYI